MGDQCYYWPARHTLTPVCLFPSTRFCSSLDPSSPHPLIPLPLSSLPPPPLTPLSSTSIPPPSLPFGDTIKSLLQGLFRVKTVIMQMKPGDHFLCVRGRVVSTTQASDIPRALESEGFSNWLSHP